MARHACQQNLLLHIGCGITSQTPGPTKGILDYSYCYEISSYRFRYVKIIKLINQDDEFLKTSRMPILQIQTSTLRADSVLNYIR